MQTDIMVDFGTTQVGREKVSRLIENLEKSYPEADIHIQEPKGAFPSASDPLTIIIAANASVQLIACIYPKLKDKISEIKGETEILNIEDIAVEYLEQHTRVSKELLDLKKKEVSGGYLIFVFEYLEDKSEHQIKIKRDDVRDWRYKEL